MSDCPFCGCGPSREAAVMIDAHPVTDGHSLVVSAEHAPPYALGADAWAAMWQLARETGDALLENGDVTGVNYGLNDGASAGQTIEHAHIHVIPRRDGDVEDPRGGVRWVIPEKAVYQGVQA